MCVVVCVVARVEASGCAGAHLLLPDLHPEGGVGREPHGRAAEVHEAAQQTALPQRLRVLPCESGTGSEGECFCLGESLHT